MASNIIRQTITSNGTGKDFYDAVDTVMVANGFVKDTNLSTDWDRCYRLHADDLVGIKIYDKWQDTTNTSYQVYFNVFYGIVDKTYISSSAFCSYKSFGVILSSSTTRTIQMQIIKNNGDVSIGLANYDATACTSSPMHLINLTKVDGSKSTIGLNGTTAHDGVMAIKPVMQNPVTPYIKPLLALTLCHMCQMIHSKDNQFHLLCSVCLILPLTNR